MKVSTRKLIWPSGTFTNNLFPPRLWGKCSKLNLIRRSNWNRLIFKNKWSMEVTPLVVLPPRISSGRNPSIASHHSGLRTSYPMYPMGSRNKSPYLHPSIYPHQDEAKLQQQQLHNQQRIFFSALLNPSNPILIASVFSRTTVTFTTFKTGKLNNTNNHFNFANRSFNFWMTETKTEVSTSKATFFVVGCTPNPFPFSVCSAKR